MLWACLCFWKSKLVLMFPGKEPIMCTEPAARGYSFALLSTPELLMAPFLLMSVSMSEDDPSETTSPESPCLCNSLH